MGSDGICKNHADGKHRYKDVSVRREEKFNYHFQKCSCGKDNLWVERVERGKGGRKPGPRT